MTVEISIKIWQTVGIWPFLLASSDADVDASIDMIWYDMISLYWFVFRNFCLWNNKQQFVYKTYAESNANNGFYYGFIGFSDLLSRWASFPRFQAKPVIGERMRIWPKSIGWLKISQNTKKIIITLSIHSPLKRCNRFRVFEGIYMWLFNPPVI